MKQHIQLDVSLERILNSGYAAICVFFAVSGLLLIHSFLKTKSESDIRYPWVHFFTKRIFRIFPLWIVATIMHAVYSGRYNPEIFFKSLFFLDVMTPYSFSNILAPISWSLYIEEVFYLSFPILFLIIKKDWLIPAGLFCILTGSLLNNFVVIPEGYHFSNPFYMLYYFAFGIGAYLLWPGLRRNSIPPWLFYIIFLGQILYVALIQKNDKFSEINILFCFLFILQSPKMFSKVTHFLFNGLGKLCFPFYLVHSIAIGMSRTLFFQIFGIESNKSLNNLQLFTIFILSLLISVTASIVLHRLIERPFIILGAKISLRIQDAINSLSTWRKSLS